MVVFDMIARMRNPVDQFAEKLRALRKAHGYAADKLSHDCGVARSSLGRWEREECSVNRSVLQRVAEKLELSAADRRELFRLADMRDAPEQAKDLYQSAVDPDENLLRSLLDIDHEWPSEPKSPTAKSERTQLLLDALAWPLLYNMFRAAPEMARLRWPERIEELWGISPVKSNCPPKAEDRIVTPEHILSEEAPFLSELSSETTALDSTTQSIGMARVYRRTIFGDLQRARDAVANFQGWAFDRMQHLAESVSLFDFIPSSAGGVGFADVSCRVAAFVGERDVASALWNSAVLCSPWRCEWQSFDWLALQTVPMADIRRLKTSFWDRQHVRDALFIFQSPSWLTVADVICSRFGDALDSKAELESALESGTLSAETRHRIMAEPWRLAACDRQYLIRYLESRISLVPQFAETPDSLSDDPSTLPLDGRHGDTAKVAAPKARRKAKKTPKRKKRKGS